MDEEGIYGSFPFIQISTSDTTLTKVASTSVISYKSNRNIISKSSATWLTATVDAQHSQIILTYDANPMEVERKATVELFTANDMIRKTLNITQDASGEQTYSGDLILRSKEDIAANTYTKTEGSLLVGNIEQVQNKTQQSIEVDMGEYQLKVLPSNIDDRDMATLTEQIHLIGKQTIAIANTKVKQIPTELITYNAVKQVYFDNNNLTSLPSAEEMAALNLEKLSVKGNYLKTLSALQNCHSISYLDVSYNQAYNINPLLNMTGLQKVVLSGMPLTRPQVEVFRERFNGTEVIADNLDESASPLPYFEDIEVVELSDTRVKLTAKVSRNTTGINKVGFYIGDQRNIDQMTFHECTYNNNSFTMTYDVETLTNKVYHVRAYAENGVGRGYSSAGYFGSMISEEDIYIKNQEDLYNFHAIGYSHVNGSVFVGNLMSSGSSITLNYNNSTLVFAPTEELSDLTLLSGLMYVRDGLYIGNVGLSTADYISHIEGIQTLWLKGNNLTTLPILKSDNTLKSLTLSFNQIKDFNFLERMPNLTHLYLGDLNLASEETNKIYSLNGLEQFTNLKHIDLSGLPLHEWQVELLKKQLPEATIEFYPGNQTPYLPSVTTNKPKTDGTNIILRGSVSSKGMGTITEYGFYYGKDPENMEKVPIGGEIALNESFTYSVAVPDLDIYYYRAYAVNEYGESWCSSKTFTLSYVDISEDGTANCYIVPGSGKYKFNATVKGNSTESVGDPTSVSVLWGMITPEISGTVISAAALNNGYVEFSIASDIEYGNALIAVTNSSGEILWSWHIWVCDFEPEVTIQKYTSGVALMDRNLGATDNEYTTNWETFRRAEGLFYQWGRKDPFTQNNFTVRTAFNYQSEAIKAPTEFAASDHWINSDISGLWSVNKKTMYDPCPVGWRVPEIVFGNDLSATSTEYGCLVYYDGKSSTYFPSAHYIDNGSFYREIERGYYWVSNTNSNWVYATATNSWGNFERWEFGSGRGCVIRCSKDENFGVPVIESFSARATEIELKGMVDLQTFGGLADRGFVYSKDWDSNMSLGKGTSVSAGSGNGNFTATITGLSGQTLYYVRAYVRGKDVVKYGDIIEVRTSRTGLGDKFTEDEYEW